MSISLLTKVKLSVLYQHCEAGWYHKHINPCYHMSRPYSQGLSCLVSCACLSFNSFLHYCANRNDNLHTCMLGLCCYHSFQLSHPSSTVKWNITKVVIHAWFTSVQDSLTSCNCIWQKVSYTHRHKQTKSFFFIRYVMILDRILPGSVCIFSPI